MSKDAENITLHSKGGRLYVKPADILATQQAKETLKQFKQSSIYKAIKQRSRIHDGRKPSSAA